jgi:hypothetical protein
MSGCQGDPDREAAFGRDLASAKALAATLHRSVREEQIFHVDHFQGRLSAWASSRSSAQQSALPEADDSNQIGPLGPIEKTRDLLTGGGAEKNELPRAARVHYMPPPWWPRGVQGPPIPRFAGSFKPRMGFRIAPR